MNGERINVKHLTGIKHYPDRFRILTMAFLTVVAIAGQARTDNSSLNSVLTLFSRDQSQHHRIRNSVASPATTTTTTITITTTTTTTTTTNIRLSYVLRTDK
ncbi:hypothetical protein M0804_001525 [Polistes exclamans]|nr:hypothetical protein M0804_001525 [Polistes exclamans]